MGTIGAFVFFIPDVDGVAVVATVVVVAAVVVAIVAVAVVAIVVDVAIDLGFVGVLSVVTQASAISGGSRSLLGMNKSAGNNLRSSTACGLNG